MELGKYQNVLRAMKRKSGGLRTVLYDPSIEDSTIDFPDIEQPKMGFKDGGRTMTVTDKFKEANRAKAKKASEAASAAAEVRKVDKPTPIFRGDPGKLVDNKYKNETQRKRFEDLIKEKFNYPKNSVEARELDKKIMKDFDLTPSAFERVQRVVKNKYNLQQPEKQYTGPTAADRRKDKARRVAKRKFSDPTMEVKFAGPKETGVQLSHMDNLYTEFVTGQNLGYAPSEINQTLLEKYDREFKKLYNERARVKRNKPKDMEAKLRDINLRGMRLQGETQGFKTFNIEDPVTGKAIPNPIQSKFNIDPLDLMKGKTLKESVKVLPGKGEKVLNLSDFDRELFEINRQNVIESVKKQSPELTKKFQEGLSEIDNKNAVNIISSVACPNQYADGGRVNFKKGSNCFLRGAEIINDAKAGNPSALQKVRKYLKTPGARIGMGVLAELGLEGLFAVEGIAEGKPFDQVLGESIFGLAGFGSTEEEQILKSADPKDIENVKAYQKKLANEDKLSANVGFEKTVQPETGEESTEDFFTVESLRPAIDKQKKQLQKDFKDPNLDEEEEAYGRAYKNYLEENKKRAEEQGYRKPFQFIKEEIYDPTGEAIMKAYEAVENLFADGGRVEMSEGGDPKDKMKTPFDKPTLPLDPNQIPQVQNPGRRVFVKGAGMIGAGIAAFAAGLLRLGRKDSAKKLVQKAATYGGRRIDGVPEIILDLVGTIKSNGKLVDAPKPGSGPMVYRLENYEYAEDVNGFTINKINDRGDYGYTEEVFQFEKDAETGATFFDDLTVRPDGDGKLKDVEYGIDTDAYNEIADDLAKFNKIQPNDTRFKDKAKKWIDEDKQMNEGIEPKPGTELD